MKYRTPPVRWFQRIARRCVARLAFASCLLTACSALADSVIPDTRIFTNISAFLGVRGGIDYRSTVSDDGNANGLTDSLESIDNTGATSVMMAISNAVQTASSNTAVVIGPGSYLIIASGDSTKLPWSKSGVTVRGRDGPIATRFIIAGAASGNSAVYLSSGNHDYGFTGLKYDLWNTTLSPYDSNLSTTATHSLAVGDRVWINQKTNGIIHSGGASGACGFCSGDGDSSRVYGQWSEVMSVSNGTNFVIDPPIIGGFQSTNAPKVYKGSGWVRRFGIEGITFTNTSTATAKYTLEMEGCLDSWVTNCEFSVSYRRHIHLSNNTRTQIIENHIHEGNGADWTAAYGPDRGYGIYIAYGNTLVLVENNIFDRVHFAVSFEGSLAGCVAFGNYHNRYIGNDRETAQPSIGHHGACPTMCIWEHNKVKSQFSMDRYWGGGLGYTIFRNRVSNQWSNDTTKVSQYAINLDVWATHRNHNIVGNVFGTAVADTKVWMGDGDSVNSGGIRMIYRMGNWTANANTLSAYDAVSNSCIIRANYDYVTGGVPSDQSIGSTNLVDSYVKASKPSWWGTNRWPAIGSDLSPVESLIPAEIRFLALGGAGVTNYLQSGGGGGPDPSATAVIGPGARLPRSL